MLKQVDVPASPTMGIEGENYYGYDATQRRVYKQIDRVVGKSPPPVTVEHIVYIHAGPNVIAEYDAGTAAASPSQEYVYAQEIDSLVLLVRNGGSDKFTITRNQQWSVTALADLSTGSVVERYTYDAFGKRTMLAPDGSTVRTTSSYDMPFGYTSRQHDPETGLMYFRARYYDPSTSEFLSQDPLEYVDGMSVFRGYFVPGATDPAGKKISCFCCGFVGLFLGVELTVCAGVCSEDGKWDSSSDTFLGCLEKCMTATGAALPGAGLPICCGLCFIPALTF
jgi:RHS repeat-associated protein